MRNLIDIMELSVEELQELVDCAMDIIANPQKYAEACHLRGTTQVDAA